jgi:NADP-dependent aldehyde dehydrogenase
MTPHFQDATPAAIEAALRQLQAAAPALAATTLAQRADMMHTIAELLEQSGDTLLHLAMEETHLPESRLRAERARTVFQWRNYADACRRGDWLEVRIDTADAGKTPPKPDLRKMNVPLGPVLVFGASNFPFAYTASAFAAGCPVVLKAHPAHARTSEAVAALVHQGLQKHGLPTALFVHLHGSSTQVGQALVKHPAIKAVGFTGSFAGGKALFDAANQRPDPIPVFAEMGSVNPVFLLPDKLATDAAAVAQQYAASITLGVGQFCTNPGLLIGMAGATFDAFAAALAEAIGRVPAGTMLHQGIADAFEMNKAKALAQQGVQLVAKGLPGQDALQASATIALVSAADFLQQPALHHEVFGPFSLLVKCENAAELYAVAQALEGQLTCSLMATASDLDAFAGLLPIVSGKCGRLVLNGVPTGVEVCEAMQHGGPFPATTDSRFGSVGADAIRRFCRPLAYQNWPDDYLPAALQNSNPWQLWRRVNGSWSKEPLV